MDKLAGIFRVKKVGTYDFVLALATIAILGALSAISVYGTVVSWMNSLAYPEWTSTVLYGDYLDRMNAYAYPFVLGLVLVLCMCIPKRFISRTYLLQISAGLLALSILIGATWGFVAGLGFLLVVSAFLQILVVVMVATRSGGLVFEREGLMVQLGSALLHLGFVIFVMDIVLVKQAQNHLDVFWIATALITVGSVLSFYARELSSAMRRMLGTQRITLPTVVGRPAPEAEGAPTGTVPAFEAEE